MELKNYLESLGFENVTEVYCKTLFGEDDSELSYTHGKTRFIVHSITLRNLIRTKEVITSTDVITISYR